MSSGGAAMTREELHDFADALGLKTEPAPLPGEWFTDRWWEVRPGWEVRYADRVWRVFDRGGVPEEMWVLLRRKDVDGRVVAHVVGSAVPLRGYALVECREGRLTPEVYRDFGLWGEES